ncbi:MAG: Gfo/Idh/MocA family oxidoreductase [Verrucomicrobia bacterium]|nr:Gfo/Idh/MocA family oxidoreductase [Verrucomicrobiota bacterium]
MADMRIAFIGAGAIAQRHLKTVAALCGEKPLVAACDIDRARAATACQAYGGNPYEDAALMFKAESPDVVFICTPPFAREDAVKLCCRKKVPFFCEKPPAADLKTAAKIAEAVEKAGVVHTVGFMYRHAETVDECRRWLEGAAITSVVSQVACGVLFDPNLHAWSKLMDKSGGPLMEQAINLVDLIRSLAGEITEVYAFGSNQLVPRSETMTVPETVTLAYRLASGAVGCHYHSWAHKVWTCQMELRSDESRVLLDFATGKATGNIKGEPKEAATQKDYYVTEIERFLQAVKENNPSLVRSTYADATKSLAVVLAANRSLETGKPEKVKEV